ncbi:MAG: hypothetical protein ABUS57_02425, partial [Pseudomonadota bacterium]
TIDGEQCSRLFGLINDFENWPDLERIIRRFAQTRFAKDRVDMHLDLGIVAEALLTHGDKTTTEVKQRLCTRAAWLLGHSKADRIAIRKRMSRLYDYRSAAAHSGKLRGKWERQDLDDAVELCRQLIAQTLERNDFVRDWDPIVF